MSISSKLSWSEFEHLTNQEVTKIVELSNLNSILIAFDGTQRWFLCDHIKQNQLKEIPSNYLPLYLQSFTEQRMNIFRMFFLNGVTSIFEPFIIPYNRLSAKEFKREMRIIPHLLGSEDSLNFYKEFQTQVRFYGEWKSFFQEIGLPSYIDTLQHIEKLTADYQERYLYFGLHTPDTDPEIEIIEHAWQANTNPEAPSIENLMKSYYGHVPLPISLAIFLVGQPGLSTYLPPLLTKETIFYLTLNSPLGITIRQCRQVFYDYLYCRRKENRNYKLPQKISEDIDIPEPLKSLRTFYSFNKEVIFGTGQWHSDGEFWYPLSCVNIPEDWEKIQDTKLDLISEKFTQ